MIELSNVELIEIFNENQKQLLITSSLTFVKLSRIFIRAINIKECGNIDTDFHHQIEWNEMHLNFSSELLKIIFTLLYYKLGYQNKIVNSVMATI